MKVQTAKRAAQQWVAEYGSREKHFLGAYFSGSIVGMDDDAELPESSDVDVMVVLALDAPPPKPGKFRCRDVLLEVTFLPWDALSSPEEVLASHHLGHSLRVDTVIADPSGRIRPLQEQVAAYFADREWVIRRCENVLGRIERGLRGIDAGAPFYNRITQWLFPTGIMTHVILLAALQNPTVRRRYAAARDVLLEYGHGDFYQRLLDLLGCGQMTPTRAEEHLHGLMKTFDAAAAVAKTPFPFSSDITALARPIAIDGSRRLIREGFHREAVFWMAATYARCHQILAADAPPETARIHMTAFKALTDDLGITSVDDMTDRSHQALAFLPDLRAVTEDILRRNPGITGEAV